MLKKSDEPTAQRPLGAWAEALSAELLEAQTLLAGGDSAGAEKRARAVTTIARAARDVAELYALDGADAQEQEDLDLARARLADELDRFLAAERAPEIPAALIAQGYSGLAE